ncbi:putative protein in bacteria [Phaeobacter porticola]|uniref:DUF1311 domain-containing protein n=2 Tax=Phaeobacter porticola TaxID=1844006 RepID=A0A1L3IA10_9RHOB|nr:putative protein in bacteria [Phaeobacter porticola]
MRTCMFLALLALPSPALADPAMECSEMATQVKVRTCLETDKTRTNMALSRAFEYARESAADLDVSTGRYSAVPALEVG